MNNQGNPGKKHGNRQGQGKKSKFSAQKRNRIILSHDNQLSLGVDIPSEK